MDFVTGLRCRECARPYPAVALHVCDYCFGPLEVVYDYEALRATLTRAQILSQAATTVLSQANSAPQNVLTLLQGH